MTPIRRVLPGLLLVVAASALVPAPASAQGTPIVGVCSFPISHEFPKTHGDKGHDLPPPAPYDGMDTGQVTVVITNLTNGKSATAPANSATFYVDDFHAYFRGSSVTFFNSPRGEVPKGVFVIVGDAFTTFDDQGGITSVQNVVIRRDICTEIA